MRKTEAILKDAAAALDDGIADRDEILRALTKILRREASEDALQKVRTENYVPDAYGDVIRQKDEKVETVKIRPRLADVIRAAELLGRANGLFTAHACGDLAVPLVFCGEDELK
ncbi:MAG: hypothetical protein IJS44_02880 [Clostridia bacterium]|nr:hypothetical protein [Clostridia bacterium]